MNQNQTTPITPIDLLRKSHYFLENDCDSSSGIRTAYRRRQRAVIMLQESLCSSIQGESSIVESTSIDLTD